jgi:hypothetical protein
MTSPFITPSLEEEQTNGTLYEDSCFGNPDGRFDVARGEAMTANPMQIQVHKAISSPLPNVQLVAAHSDVAAARGQTEQIIVRSGSDYQKYPESVGG